MLNPQDIVKNSEDYLPHSLNSIKKTSDREFTLRRATRKSKLKEACFGLGKISKEIFFARRQQVGYKNEIGHMPNVCNLIYLETSSPQRQVNYYIAVAVRGPPPSSEILSMRRGPNALLQSHLAT